MAVSLFSGMVMVAVVASSVVQRCSVGAEAWIQLDKVAPRHSPFASKQQHSKPRSRLVTSFVSNDVESQERTGLQQSTSYKQRTVRLSKPMGLILEQDANVTDSCVKIASMGGAAAKASQRGEIDLCIGDVVAQVDSVSCQDWSLEQVMDAIANAPDPVTLVVTRPEDSIRVLFVETGVAIAAKPKMSIGALARTAEAKILYSCRNGGCGTCEQIMITVDDSQNKQTERYVRPCVARVPKGVESITIVPSDRYEPT